MIDLKNMEPFVELPEALSHAETQTLKAMEDLGGKFKPSASTGNFYPPSENDEWTNGMWTGEINVMYELTGKDIFRKKALEHVDSFYDRIVSMSSINNHDMGFLYSPSCVAAYLLYGSDKGRDAAIMAADYLISRFAEIATYCGTTVATVLFPFAVSAKTRGEGSAALRNGALLAILGGGAALAVALWLGLPWLFAHLPGYAPYISAAPLAGYLALTTTLNVACAGHFAHQQARDDFRYLFYMVPCAAFACAALVSLSDATLLRALHVLFACALLQAVCVAVDLLLRRARD